MDDQTFRERSDASLSRVAKWLEELDPDEVDYSTGDGVVTIEFADGAKFVLSRQAQMKQMWLAAGAHGYHYKWDDSGTTWLDDKDGHELYPRIAEVVADQVGHPIDGRP
ncbi:MAG: Frataxin CyaY, facilitates iron supply for heme synthesis or Fe-S cluster assembly [Candidatus Binatus sp.]|jgi:iron donor protein CyaY|nr:Frataxin CyaY, facilitates iron supply for heme synthesis or Fe-S cluster assembly [Candidatus Binatus sp.]